MRFEEKGPTVKDFEGHVRCLYFISQRAETRLWTRRGQKRKKREFRRSEYHGPLVAVCPWTLAPSKGLLTPLRFSFSELENGDVGHLTVGAIGFLGFSD